MQNVTNILSTAATSYSLLRGSTTKVQLSYYTTQELTEASHYTLNFKMAAKLCYNSSGSQGRATSVASQVFLYNMMAIFCFVFSSQVKLSL